MHAHVTEQGLCPRSGTHGRSCCCTLKFAALLTPCLLSLCTRPFGSLLTHDAHILPIGHNLRVSATHAPCCGLGQQGLGVVWARTAGPCALPLLLLVPSGALALPLASGCTANTCHVHTYTRPADQGSNQHARPATPAPDLCVRHVCTVASGCRPAVGVPRNAALPWATHLSKFVSGTASCRE